MLNSELVKLAEKVRRMRESQKRYFEDRTGASLREAKCHEQHVDDAVAWVLAAVEAMQASDLPRVRPEPRQQRTLGD